MTAIIKRIIDWSVTMDGDEPTIRDEELGERLGFTRPRKIRELIERMIAEGILTIPTFAPRWGGWRPASRRSESRGTC